VFVISWIDLFETAVEMISSLSVSAVTTIVLSWSWLFML
jgi:hypothetical protein